MTMRLHRSIVPVLVALAFVAVLFVGVFPTRTYLAQRDEMAQSRDRLSELDTANVELQARVDALESPAEVERLAREEFGMVRPGEEPYRILPAPEQPVPVPDTWPFGRLGALYAS